MLMQAVLAAAQTNNVLTNEQVISLLFGHGFGHVSHTGILGVIGALLLMSSTIAANWSNVLL